MPESQATTRNTSNRRRFQIVDAVVLIAATSVGLALVRATGVSEFIHERFVGPDSVEAQSTTLWGPDSSAGSSLADLATTLLVPTSFALAALRLRQPRPRRLRLVAQPGFVATAAASLTLTVAAAETQIAFFRFDSSTISWEMKFELMSFAGRIAYVIAACWVLLVTSARWRAEPSWIDRAGRIVAVLWIVAFLMRNSPWFIP